MISRKLVFIIISILTYNLSTAQPVQIGGTYNSQQLVIVKTIGWNDIHGRLTAYEWNDSKWKEVLKDIPVIVGRSGLAWGKSLLKTQNTEGKQKKEGDGNSPAGIFKLTGLFGYNDFDSKMNSLKVDTATYCVDDLKSKYYNRIVKTDTVKKEWNSAETMKLKDDEYKYGVFVAYNTSEIEPGKGSCIFMHIWKNSENPTSGCTAMTEENIIKLISFLDKNKNPLLIQLPANEYKKLGKTYILP
ncbi:L,D-transpeptidase family protein [Pedobacter sp. HMF7647]|uniref:L,D-transpeptidase family protein n=1 Tax=Hufsiella arboris TaxID=2695275 RepID=A0A7K1Y6P0_9SPHI|nr:L,D-transpeptidase family protein [Hufsiella arboris]MXV49789.1 L,D-transpeptidase family protein [Hufsiella arboris]